MLGYLYLVVSSIFGRLIRIKFEMTAKKVFESVAPGGKHPPEWTFNIPFDFIVGTTMLTTVHYFVSYLFAMFISETSNPLLYANITVICILMPILLISYFKMDRVVMIKPIHSSQKNKARFYQVSVIILGIFGLFLMFYVFFIRDGILNSGYTVFSDFAPHTAVINSFSKGANFPTEYPHFAGDGINYHFFFFYLCGNLQYLGMPMDFAMNIPSLLGLLSFTTLLGSFGVLITGQRGVFFLAPFMLFFRSSNAIFPYLKELYEKRGNDWMGILTDALKKSDVFIGNITIQDSWGFWAMNVYANQRHLLWGFSIVIILLFLFYPTLHRGPKPDKNLENPHQGFLRKWFCGPVRYIIGREYWGIGNVRTLILSVILIVLLPYWHGSMFITVLCILFVMAFFAKNRLSYLILALSGVGASLGWTQFFSGGANQVTNPRILIGFLSPDPSFFGILNYIFQLLGISVILIVLVWVLERSREKRVLILAFLSPLVLAFTVSLTPDVGVNHKYILATYALINIFVAYLLIRLFSRTGELIRRFTGTLHALYQTRRKRRENTKAHDQPNPYLLFRETKQRNYLTKAKVLWLEIFTSTVSVVVVLMISFSLFSTGVMDLVVYTNKNRNDVKIDLHSPLISWVEANTNPRDVFLTDKYSMHEIFFTGRKIFYGWPYFTWSAGYDTTTRKEIVNELFRGYDGDVEQFLRVAKDYHIKYVLMDNGLLRNSEYIVDQEFFMEHFEEVLSLPDKGGLILYKLYD